MRHARAGARRRAEEKAEGEKTGIKQKRFQAFLSGARERASRAPAAGIPAAVLTKRKKVRRGAMAQESEAGQVGTK